MYSNNKQFTIVLFFLLIACSSCSDQIKHTQNNPIERSTLFERDAKEALIKELDHFQPNELEYAIEDYEEKDGKKYLITQVSTNQFQSNMALRIPDSSAGLEHVVAKKSVSYRGAVLKGLQYRIEKTTNNIDFVFESVDQIID